MKVLVDTVPPEVRLEGLPRRGSLASVRWELIDDRIDLGSVLLEYQTAGALEWSQVAIRKPGRIGRETWDAGTAEPLKVRMSVSDKVGNSKAVSLSLPDGLPRDDGGGSTGEPSDPTIPPPRGTFASSESERSRPSPIASGPPPMPGVGAENGPSRGSSDGSFNPFQGEDPRPANPSSKPEPTDPTNPPIQVASPKFGLKYEVEDAGPNGPAAVELFVTTDGGRTWYSRGEDTDRTSPFPVDLGGEGTFGLKLVAKSAANQGDQPPAPGEVPRTIVEVDSSPPNVRLESGPNRRPEGCHHLASERPPPGHSVGDDRRQVRCRRLQLAADHAISHRKHRPVHLVAAGQLSGPSPFPGRRGRFAGQPRSGRHDRIRRRTR